MRVIHHPSDHAALYYSGMDSCVTLAVFRALKPSPEALSIYEFEKELQAPALEMMLRGLRVDPNARWELINKLRQDLEQLHDVLQRMLAAVSFRYDHKLPNSPKQLIDLFHGHLGLPLPRRYGKMKADRDALESLLPYHTARPIVRTILLIKDKGKLLQVLTKAKGDRIHTSYNIGGTYTGRWSSSAPALGFGDNLQNWTDEARQIIVPDHGKKFAYIDLEQAESRAVAYLSGDEAYIEACESEDLHSTVSGMVWPRKDPRERYYRHFTYRDMAKRAGHATNYYATAGTIAARLHIPLSVATAFQEAYFARFPKIREWHSRVSRELISSGRIATPFGRVIQFFGRRDDETLRKAIAAGPQSTVADALNAGMLQLWRAHVPGVDLLAQVHDAVLVQYPDEAEDTVLPRLMELILVPIQVGSRTLVIPCDAKVGWSWSESTPHGLQKYKGHDTRERPAEASILDRCVP